MTSLGLERDVIDRDTYRRTVDWFRSAGVLLPTFAELAAPDTIPAAIREPLKAVRPGPGRSGGTCSGCTGTTTATGPARPPSRCTWCCPPS